MSQFNVAIVGGGITGLILAIGLRRRNVSCTIYERAGSFSELGTGIGFSPNAEAAMEIVDPRVREAYMRAITPNGEDYFQWVDGHGTDEVKYRLYLGKDGFQGGRRSEILQAWVELLPADSVQFNKDVADIEDKENAPVTLRFVIGCDGVWSRMRTLLFGTEYRATYSHQFCFRAVVPMDAARAAIGDHRASTRFMYNGPGAHAITYPVAQGALLNILVVVADPNPWPVQNGGSTATAQDSAVATRQTTGMGRREDAEKAFAGWHKTAQGVVGLLPEEPPRWAIFDMLEHPVPSYAQGQAALAGDAAHAAGPHLGAGAGFGIEDGLVLATLLGDLAKEGSRDQQPVSAARISAALRAYNSIRYGRTQWLVKNTRDAVNLFQWRDDTHGQDWEAFSREITWRFHHIWEEDMDAVLTKARKCYSDNVAGEA